MRTLASFLIVLVIAAVSPLRAPAAAPPEPIKPVPTPQQLAWHDLDFYAFVHFNMNTFTGVEWGHGTESAKQFNPTQFDARQWCRIFKEAGMTAVILTAKHHDGFCLWPSDFTEHDVASSPWKNGQGDVVRELADACNEYGLKLGIYISPWDRNHPLYGRHDKAYNDYFANQLRELLTNYGPIFEVWWDGANGDRDNPDKFQEYDWDRFIAIVRELQPDAVIFSGNGDIRWIGNERGFANATQWCMFSFDQLAVNHTGSNQRYLETGMENGDRWYPGEVDVSIRPGWYYRPSEDDKVKSVDKLLEIYYESVGRNANLLLNIPVDDRGLVHENDAKALLTMANVIERTYDNDLAVKQRASADNQRGNDATFAPSKVTDGDPATYWATDDDVRTASVTIQFDKPVWFNRVRMEEPIQLGQRVRAFTLEAKATDGTWSAIGSGTTIGDQCIVRTDAVEAVALRLNVLDARACPAIERIGVFAAPPRVKIDAPTHAFVDKTAVTLTAEYPGTAIHYTLDGSQPDADSPRYAQPLALDRDTTLRAVAVRDGQLSPLVTEATFKRFDASALRKPANAEPTEPGLHYAYYEGGWQTLDQMKDRQPVATGIVKGISLAPRKRDDHFAMRFDGYFHASADGVYSFSTASDDGSRLYIGDELVVENNGLHGLIERSGTIGLRAGYHPIRIEYFNATGGEAGMGLRVRWAGPATSKRALDGQVLWR